MSIERKAGSLTGEACIGRVFLSKRGKTLYHDGRAFQSLKRQGLEANFRELATGEGYRISGCKRDGPDRLYGERAPVEIDDASRREYWLHIRRAPQRVHEPITNCS